MSAEYLNHSYVVETLVNVVARKPVQGGAR